MTRKEKAVFVGEMFRDAYEALKKAPHMGTFLELTISMNGKPAARFTHGTIEFDDFEDLTRWLNLTDQEKWEEARASR